MVKAIVFDSGVGGLSVVAHIRALMPKLHFDYVADDAFRPYGDKTETELKARLPGLLRTLEIMLQPDVIVIACNTASTAALREIRTHVTCPVIGVVPAIKPAAETSKSKTIAVLGTPGTVRRKYVDQLITDFAGDCRVILHGSTGLVGLAEAKLTGHSISQSQIQQEITPLFEQDPAHILDTIVLACTHFPLLLNELEMAAPHPLTWIESGPAIARRLKTILKTCKNKSAATHPQTAFCMGSSQNPERTAMFAQYGFIKTVSL